MPEVDGAGKEAEETRVEDGHLEDGLDETEETLKAGYERVLAAVEVIMAARRYSPASVPNRMNCSSIKAIVPFCPAPYSHIGVDMCIGPPEKAVFVV